MSVISLLHRAAETEGVEGRVKKTGSGSGFYVPFVR